MRCSTAVASLFAELPRRSTKKAIDCRVSYGSSAKVPVVNLAPALNSYHDHSPIQTVSASRAGVGRALTTECQRMYQ